MKEFFTQAPFDFFNKCNILIAVFESEKRKVPAKMNEILRFVRISLFPLQLALANELIKGGNTVVELATGEGKTVIVLPVIANTAFVKEEQVLFVVPEKNLGYQQAEKIRVNLNFPENLKKETAVSFISGETAPSYRIEKWRETRIVVATPHIVVNDAISGRLQLEQFGLVILDECHHATGKTAMAKLLHELLCYEKIQIVGLSATMGKSTSQQPSLFKEGNIQTTRELFTNYDFTLITPQAPSLNSLENASFARVRTEHNYQVPIPPLYQSLLEDAEKISRRYLQTLEQSLVDAGINWNLITKIPAGKVKASDCSAMFRNCQSILSKSGDETLKLRIFYPLLDWALFLYPHLLLQSESLTCSLFYLQNKLENYSRRHEERLRRGVKSSQENYNDLIEFYQKTYHLVKYFSLEHPKVEHLLGLALKQVQMGNRLLVFVNYTEVGLELVTRLNDKIVLEHNIPAYAYYLFGGSHHRPKERKRIARAFGSGEITILVTTIYEGLDLHAQTGIIYSPPQNTKQYIQEIGRIAHQPDSAGTIFRLRVDIPREQALWARALKGENINTTPLELDSESMTSYPWAKASKHDRQRIIALEDETPVNERFRVLRKTPLNHNKQGMLYFYLEVADRDKQGQTHTIDVYCSHPSQLALSSIYDSVDVGDVVVIKGLARISSNLVLQIFAQYVEAIPNQCYLEEDFPPTIN